MNTNEIWPYPGFDTRGRQEEVLAALRLGCPDIEFQPVTMANPADLSGVTALKDQVQGILVYVMTLDWAQSQTVVAIGQLRKPLLVVDEFLGGCGAFLIACSGLPAQGIPAAVRVHHAAGRRDSGRTRVWRTPQSGRDGREVRTALRSWSIERRSHADRTRSARRIACN